MLSLNNASKSRKFFTAVCLEEKNPSNYSLFKKKRRVTYLANIYGEDKHPPKIPANNY